MELHANAALSLKGRRQLAHRVVKGGWSLAEAAAAAEVSERTAAKWAGRFRQEGRPACSIAPRRRIAWPTAPTSYELALSPPCAGCA